MRCLVLLVALGACGGDDAPAPRPKARPPHDAAPLDAAVAVMTLDDAELAAIVDHPTPREHRILHVTLDSTPPHARVWVDGVAIGTTPAYWDGEANGCVREFRFEQDGYVGMSYRFVPVQDGFVHGQLERIIEDGDGGVPEVVEAQPIAPCPTPTQIARPRRPATPRPATPPPDAAPAPALVDAAPAAPDASPQ